jgi:DNA-binding NarL/FixJ family response regulator
MPEVKIVMLTAFDDDEDLFEAMKNGAAGYVLKNVKAEEFIDLLSNVMRGEVVVSPWIASKIAEELFHNPARLGAKNTEYDLSTREKEVLRLVTGGATNKEIASSLYISHNTVKYHLRNIMEKLHVRNRAQIAVYGVEKGLSQSPEKKQAHN